MSTFLLEVGTEELPAQFVASALEQWRSLIPQSLETARLTPGTLTVYGTPRRLALVATGLPDCQPTQQEEIKGPPATAAFKDGKPTPAALGFAKKQGVDVSTFEVRSTPKGDFVYINKTTPGRAALDVLPELIPQWINALEGKRFMRWGDGELRFSRPIRWLVALWDDQVLPVTLVNAETTLKSDRVSQAHRVLHPDPIQIDHANQYVEALMAGSVMVDPSHRQQVIEDQVKAIAKTVKGTAMIPADLLQEVVQLVEWPTAVIGQFEADFLSLPAEVTTTEMIAHQRYFPVHAPKNPAKLLPHFIAISNGNPAKSALITQGNERVIRARLSDGQFFYQADRAIALADYLPKLETVTFQEDLGSMRAKVDRIGQIAQRICQQLKLPKAQTQEVERAALLCKADLVTQMVGEFPELQGIMGQQYAFASGEPVAVATAIQEHYLPKGAGDVLPRTLVGQCVAIADRLDTLVCIFGLGLIPSGSSDPFALRRAANAIISIIWAANLELNLATLLEDTATAFATTFGKQAAQTELVQTLRNFLVQRVRTLLQDEHGVDYDLVNATVSETDGEYQARVLENLLDGRDRALYLQSLRQNGTLAQLFETINRATRLANQGDLSLDILDPANVIDPQRFEQPSEGALHQALVALLPRTQSAQTQRNYTILVQGLLEIAPKIASFFDGPESVLVMAEDTAVRKNRLNLLGLLRNHGRVLADFGEIVKGEAGA
jgi:glycyl-tRNA synthetase beta chain